MRTIPTLYAGAFLLAVIAFGRWLSTRRHTPPVLEDDNRVSDQWLKEQSYAAGHRGYEL